MYKILTQDDFKNVSENIITLAVNSNGFCYGFSCKKEELKQNSVGWVITTNCDIVWIGGNYENKSWKNHIIGRNENIFR